MLLWTIQPEAVYEQIMRDGVYRNTDAYDEDMTDYPWAVEWLSAEMEKRVGPKPEGVLQPVRGWLRWEIEKPRPDLRWMRWNRKPWGNHVLMQADIPEEQVLFIDARCWNCILNKWVIANSEEEYERLSAERDSLAPDKQKAVLWRNWNRAFNTDYFKNEWRTNGSEVEALFWELRKEQIRAAKPFKSRPQKMDRDV